MAKLISRPAGSRPKFYRRSKRGNFVLEYYRPTNFLLSFGVGRFEIQINFWGRMKFDGS